MRSPEERIKKVEILRCKNCQQYTLQEQCPYCKQQAVSPKPAKYSPEDTYGKYRRIFKKSQTL